MFSRRVLLALFGMIFSIPVLFCSAYPDTLQVIVKNDSVTFGVSENPDDLRSYGAQLVISYQQGWFGYTQIDGLTNRSALFGNEGRYDEWNTVLGYSFRLFTQSLPKRFTWSVAPRLGLVFSGNLGLDGIQRFWHDLRDIPYPELLYDDGGKVIVSPVMAVESTFGFTQVSPWFKTTDIVVEVKGNAMFSPLYEQRISIGMEFGQRTGIGSFILLGLGYGIQENLDGRVTHEAVDDAENGVYASLNARFGVIAMSYRWNLSGYIGYGGIGIDIGGLPATRWVSSDIVMTVGMRSPQEGLTTRISYKVVPHWSLFASNAYCMRKLLAGYVIREHISTWLIGVDFQWEVDSDGLVTAFSSFGGGLRRFLCVTYGGDDLWQRNVIFSQVRFCAELFGGMRFFENGEIQWNGVSYSLEVGGGILFSDTGGMENSVGGVDLLRTESWEPFIRVGILAGVSG
ncbi:MAG: hypothetical protein AB9828_02050 [Sphaerochaetaceae bacterium]